MMNLYQLTNRIGHLS